MKKIDLGQTINTVANVGVVVGIVFLAIEVSQNKASLDEANAINRATATSAVVERYNDFRALLMQNDKLRQVYRDGRSGAELSPDDTHQFGLICRSYLWNAVMMHERYESLGLESRAQGAIAMWEAEILENPGSRDCWVQQKDILIRSGYESFVEAAEDFEPQ